MPYRETERTRAAAQRRKELFVVAAGDLVARRGFAGATVKAIAAQCEVSVGSVYSYFDGRVDLLAEVFRRDAARELALVDEAVAAAGSSAAEKVDVHVRTFASRALRGRRLAWSLLFEPVDRVIDAERLRFRAEYMAIFERVLSDGVASGELPPQHLPTSASALVGAVAEGLVGRLSPAPALVDPAVTDEAVVTGIRNFCRRAIGAGS